VVVVVVPILVVICCLSTLYTTPSSPPHPLIPSSPRYKNGTGHVYAPPLSWSADERKTLANSILVEYTNLFDIW
jgi:hypothetical protein